MGVTRAPRAVSGTSPAPEEQAPRTAPKATRSAAAGRMGLIWNSSVSGGTVVDDVQLDAAVLRTPPGRGVVRHRPLEAEPGGGEPVRGDAARDERAGDGPRAPLREHLVVLAAAAGVGV